MIFDLTGPPQPKTQIVATPVFCKVSNIQIFAGLDVCIFKGSNVAMFEG